MMLFENTKMQDTESNLCFRPLFKFSVFLLLYIYMAAESMKLCSMQMIRHLPRHSKHHCYLGIIKSPHADPDEKGIL